MLVMVEMKVLMVIMLSAMILVVDFETAALLRFGNLWACSVGLTVCVVRPEESLEQLWQPYHLFRFLCFLVESHFSGSK